MAKRATARSKRQRNGGAPAVNYALTDRFAGHLARVVQVRLFQLYYERLGRLGVSPGVFAALTVIRSNPGIAHGALAETLAARGPNVTKLVDKLVRDGWVERRTLPEDGRTRGHFLTPAGRAKADAIIKAGLAHDKFVTSSLSAAERASLLQLLAKLDRSLRVRSH
jgi:DNA-binding MarR family transcriptional regulator